MWPRVRVLGRGPQVSQPRERQGVGEWGKPASLSRWGLSGALGAIVGHTAPSARRAGLGTGLRTQTAEVGQGSEEEKPSHNLPCQLGLLYGGHFPGRMWAQT